MSYSSSHMVGPPRRVAKILFQDLLEPDRIPAEHSSSIGDLQLPGEVLTLLAQHLNQSNKLLPGPAKMFRSWNVGLLERFGETPMA